MKYNNYTTQPPRGNWFRIFCIACLLVIIYLLFNTRETVIENFSGVAKSQTTSCPPESRHDQFDPCLIKYVQEKLLLPPSGLPYTPSSVTSVGNIPVNAAVNEKVEFIREHFISKDPTPGFFIECGANDGMFISPTLKLEREYNWTGVLIEGDPTPFKKLVALHRNSWMMNAALCITTTSDVVTFQTRPGFSPGGGLLKGFAHPVAVPCVPLYTILAAMEISTVDYFSLDVEGVELSVLKTIPFDKVIFKVLMVEHAHVRGFQPAIIDFLEPNGYKFIGTLLGNGMQDSVFVHESVYTQEMVLKMKYDTSPTHAPY